MTRLLTFKSAILFAALLMFGLITLACAGDRPAYPPTRVQIVTDTVQGVPIADPYRWLEDGNSPEVEKWTQDQYDFYRKYVDDYPGKQQIHDEMTKILSSQTISTPSVRRDKYFFERRSGTQNQPVLYVKTGWNGTPEVLIDPNTLSTDGTRAMDWSYISDDGSMIAYGTSDSGSERSILHIKKVADKSILADTIPYTKWTSLTWLPKADGFYYTRLPVPGTVPKGDENYFGKVYLHMLGAKWEADPLVFQDTTGDRTIELGVSTSPDGRWLMISRGSGWSQNDVYLKDRSKPNSEFIPIVKGRPAIFSVVPLNDRMLIYTNDNAPRYRVLTASYDKPMFADWKEIIPQQKDNMDNFLVVANHIVVGWLHNACSKLELFTLDGKSVKEIPTPMLGTVRSYNGEWDGHELFFQFTSYTYPPANMRYDFTNDSLTVTEQQKVDLDLSNLQISQVWYKSKDSTPISMFIVAPKGVKLDGTNPTYLDGYGGFNISTTPAYNRRIALWLAHGFVYADVNLRGGGEYGESWHQDGMLAKKQNVFDDFIAAADYLVKSNYCTRDKLVLYGGSNGGLLIGAVLTQRPDLCGTAICDVPLLDMIRYQKFGVASIWIPEYGTADDSTQFKYIYKYSPYQHVTKGAAYPAILFRASESDGRVDPLHARKMAALMQASTSSDRPILLRIEAKAGHGQGKPIAKVIDEVTEQWCFVFKSMGIKL
ncbi:MAG TPA: prolyl oligopeptidase family serine peptidase [Candidatus Acidoferrum sp.]|nr:prolyl oligopeptidase family serine peptidase [Candidatus Acidoferrum sp.]